MFSLGYRFVWRIFIRETLTYFGWIAGMNNKQIEQRLGFLIEFLMLPNSDRMVKNLSGGQQRRVSLASALLHEPELLILDEPTVGVDPLLRQSIWDHLVEITKSGQTTVIITTHYIDETRQAHLIGLMRGGYFLAEESPEKLLTQFDCQTLEDVFLKLSVIQNMGVNDRSSIAQGVSSVLDCFRNGVVERSDRNRRRRTRKLVVRINKEYFRLPIRNATSLFMAYESILTDFATPGYHSRRNSISNGEWYSPLAVFEMTLTGSVLLVTFFTVLTGFCGMCYGFVISMRGADSERIATVYSYGSFLPDGDAGAALNLALLEGMHHILQTIAVLLPLTTATESMRSILNKGMEHVQSYRVHIFAVIFPLELHFTYDITLSHAIVLVTN
ncbi:hypothetical protein FQR65_LT17798 [Abscondita terminalis]|nr:hypothetical protein FQR65_LT17798 [Abscondita terminalis]